AEIDGRANGLDAEIGAILPLTVARPPEHPVAVEIPRQSYGGGERQRARRVVVPLPNVHERRQDRSIGDEAGEPDADEGSEPSVPRAGLAHAACRSDSKYTQRVPRQVRTAPRGAGAEDYRPGRSLRGYRRLRGRSSA